MPNMQKMLFQFTTLVYIKLFASYLEYLIGTWNWNKQVNKLSAQCSKINACYISICIFFQICQTSNFQLLQASVATYWRYGGKYYMDFVGNLLLFPAVKEFWKSVKNWHSYCQEFGVLLFLGTQCIISHLVPGLYRLTDQETSGPQASFLNQTDDLQMKLVMQKATENVHDMHSYRRSN